MKAKNNLYNFTIFLCTLPFAMTNIEIMSVILKGLANENNAIRT